MSSEKSKVKQSAAIEMLRRILAEEFAIDMTRYESWAEVAPNGNSSGGSVTFFLKGPSPIAERARLRVLNVLWNNCSGVQHKGGCEVSHGECDLNDIGQIALEFNHQRYWKPVRERRNDPAINIHFGEDPGLYLTKIGRAQKLNFLILVRFQQAPLRQAAQGDLRAPPVDPRHRS